MVAHPHIPVPDPLVVVIDDDAAVRDSLKFSLEIEGFIVHGYSNAKELLDQAGIGNVGCLIIDYHLPEMNGLEILDRLRDRHVAAPTILITSHPNVAVRRRAAEAGVPIIEKPLLGNALIEGVRDAFPRWAGPNLPDPTVPAAPY
jgi:two-component system, LuxR family, response regulator FixJ